MIFDQLDYPHMPALLFIPEPFMTSQLGQLMGFFLSAILMHLSALESDQSTTPVSQNRVASICPRSFLADIHRPLQSDTLVTPEYALHDF